MKELAFYEAAAQIIPILLLVLAFERRAFALPEDSRSGRRSRLLYRSATIYVFVVIAFAELRALRVLQTGEVRNNDDLLIWTALATEGLIVAMYAFYGRR